ncbi:MAG: hypothetical protein IT569_01510 [Leptospiraceae bacterium]|nr:hypothetical protein [Leptospiraceae bacterium]
MRYLLGFCIIAFPLIAQEQDERDDYRGLYKLPHEVITKDDLTKLSTLKNDPASQPEKLLEETTNLLNKYYSQFIGEKRILEDKLRGGRYNIKSDPTAIQAFIRELLSGKTNTGRIRDSEILYNLHLDLANLYEKKQSYHKAIESYIQAFRYRNFIPTEEYYRSDKRWPEISDNEETQKKESHKKIYNELKKSEESLKKSVDDFHELESNYAKNIISKNDFLVKKSEIQNSIREQTALVKEKETAYRDSKKNNYLPFYLKKSKEDAKILFSFAKIIKIVENENKERQKIINKTSTAGKGIFVLFDYKRNSDFFAYQQILEFAHKVDAENEEIVKAIAEESQMAGKKQNALDFYLKYENLLEKKNSNPSDRKTTNLKIAILYSDLKRYVLAADFYEKYLAKETDPKKKASIEFEVAEFYDKKLGDFEKSAKHYRNWLEFVSAVDVTTFLFAEALELKSEKFNAYYGISKLGNKEKNRDSEKENLYKAYEISSDVKKSLENEEKNQINIKKEMLQVKKDLLVSTNDEVLAKYRLLEIRYIDAGDKVNTTKTKYGKMKVVEILSRLSILEERDRNLDKTRTLYEEILEIGSEEEIARSVKNLSRLDAIQRDGIYREPNL